MAVLDVVHRVVVGLRRPQRQVDVQRGVDRRTDQGVAGGVDADGLHQVVEGDDGAGALGHAHGLAVAQQVDHLADEHLDGVGVVAQRRRGGLQAGDVTVVVGAEHVDAQVEAAVELVLRVGDVAGDVGGVAVRLDDHAVLVVAVVGRLQPPRAVVLVELAVVLQLRHGRLDGPGLEQRILVEVDVEVGAEFMQGLADVGEHQLHAGGAEGLLHLGVGAGEHVGVLLDDLRGDVGDVAAAVAVLRRRLALGGGDEGAGEAVDLLAVVVEVVLAGHLRATGRQHAAQRVADGRPAGAAQVDRAGGVGGDELQVDLGTGVIVAMAPLLAGGEDLRDDLALRRRAQADVDEARARHRRLVDAVGRGELVHQPAGDVARLRSGATGGLHGHVGGVIAVLRVAGALDDDVVGKHRRVQVVFGEDVDGEAADQGGEFGWSHGCTS